jgi:hypothetical protein
MLVSSLMIFFPVVRGGDTVRVCSQFVQFGSSLVRVIWHCVSDSWSPLYPSIFAFSALFSFEHLRRGQLLLSAQKWSFFEARGVRF